MTVAVEFEGSSMNHPSTKTIPYTSMEIGSKKYTFPFESAQNETNGSLDLLRATAL